MAVYEDISRLNHTDPVRDDRVFGVTKGGEPVRSGALVNCNGLSLRAIEYGASITELCVPDKDARSGNIVLNYDTLAQYEACPFYVGGVIGRYAGRIKGGQYSDQNDAIVRLDRNAGGHHIHGGLHGFHARVWKMSEVEEGGERALSFSLTSAAGESGYPGTLECRVSYRLTKNDILIIDYEARTDAPTHINLTQHSYFNLSGNTDQSIEDHQLRVPATHCLELDDESLPTGGMQRVAGTPLDFRVWRDLGASSSMLDHDFVLPQSDGGVRNAGSVRHPQSGRRVDVFTNQPSIHVYGGKYLTKRQGQGFAPSSGMCLETQDFPDAPNQSRFPSTLLTPRHDLSSAYDFLFFS